MTSVLQDIASVYQIFTDEVLGSGQFGVVYKGASTAIRSCALVFVFQSEMRLNVFCISCRNSQEVEPISGHQSYRQDPFSQQTREAAEERGGHLAGTGASCL